MESSFRTIILKHKNETCNFKVKDNCLKKQTIKEYFSQDCSVIYVEENKTFLLESDESNFFLNPEVNVYQIIAKGNSVLCNNYFLQCIKNKIVSNLSEDGVPKVGGAQMKRYKDILEKLYVKKDSESLKRKVSSLHFIFLCYFNKNFYP